MELLVKKTLKFVQFYILERAGFPGLAFKLRPVLIELRAWL